MITQSLSKNTNLNIDKVIQLLLSIELIAGRGACPDNLRIRISQALLSLLDLRRTSLPVKKDIVNHV